MLVLPNAFILNFLWFMGLFTLAETLLNHGKARLNKQIYHEPVLYSKKRFEKMSIPVSPLVNCVPFVFFLFVSQLKTKKSVLNFFAKERATIKII